MADAYRYAIADVFTDTPLAGNQLAVFTDARGMPEHVLQPLTAFERTAKDQAQAFRRAEERRRQDEERRLEEEARRQEQERIAREAAAIPSGPSNVEAR